MAEGVEVEGQPIKDATPSTAAEAALPGVPEGGLQTATSKDQSKALEATSSTATEGAPPGVSVGGPQQATGDNQSKDLEATPSVIDKKPKIVLYWLEKSRSQRILWLLEELKLDYEIKIYKRHNMLAPAELKQIHPLGKSPIITINADGMAKPLVLAESGLIVEYLIEHFGPHLAPQKWQDGKEGKVGGENEEWMRYRYFMHYPEGSLMTYMIVALLVQNIRSSPVPFFIRPITKSIAKKIESSFLTPNFKTHFDFLESQLATSPKDGDYFCGKEITGADILLVFPLGAARGRAGLTKEKYSRMWSYIDRLEARDGYKRAVQRIIDIDGSYNGFL